MKKYILLGILLAIVAGIILWRSSSGPGEVKIIQTANVEQGRVRNVLEATGIIQAQVGAQVKIGARATGVLVHVPVKVGDEVKAGDLVAEIDSRELQAKVDEARARLNLAEAKAVRAAKDLKRKQQLVSQELDSQSALDEAVENARVTRYEADAMRAQLDTLEVQLSYYKIYSPIDGVVSLVAAQEGETVVSGLQVSNLITVLDPTRLEMWIYVDETDVGQSREGLPVEFFVDAYPDTTFHGQIALIYPEPETRNNIVYYKALVRVEYDPATPLRPEMTTQCRIVVQEKDDVLSLPNEALKWVGGEQVVFVRHADGTVEEVVPELGLQGRNRSEVVSGLEQGAEVAVQLVLPGESMGKKGQ